MLSLTSPPGLLVVAALLARRHRASLAHWAMDLYPELALALGETGSNVVFRVLGAAMRWAYRRCALVVALDEDMRSHLQAAYGVSGVRVLEPWPSEGSGQALTAVGEPVDPWTWLYSGNLGRGHEWHTLLDAQRLLEARGLPVRLVFQGDGAARPAAMAYAASIGLQRCEWTGYVSEENLIPSLGHARLLVATQRPETRGLLWPSKLGLLEHLPRPVLFVGPADGAIARRLQRKAGSGIFAPGQAEAVAAWIEGIYRGGVNVPPAENASPLITLTDGCRQMEAWLIACLPGSSATGRERG